MNENEIYTILKGLGFVGSEIKTYLAGLENGPSTVIELTKATKLSRQATYVVIDSLTARGLMSSLIKGKKKYYVSEDPEKLLSYSKRHELEMQARLKDLERVMPVLKLKQSGDRPAVKLYEGEDGVLTTLEEMYQSQPKEIYEIGDLEAFQKLNAFDKTTMGVDQLKKIKTKVVSLSTGKPARPKLNEESRRYFLPKEISGFKSDIIVYNNRTRFMVFEGKIHAIVIENESVARAMKILFEQAFKGSKELESD